MEFNYALSTESAVRNIRKTLEPWKIHDVIFKGVEIREFDGKKDPSAHYKVLDIKFENEEGYFTLTKFFPRVGDDERRSFPGSNGGKVETASNFEVLMSIISQTGQVLNPEGFAKMQKASSKFRSFEDVANALITITNPVKGKATKLKLVGYNNKDGHVVTDIPRIVSINKNGESWISDNYIGDKLFFSDWEETQRSKYLNATPTKMEDPVEFDTTTVDATPAKSENKEDFDLEALL